MKCHYDVLGVSREATDDVIKKSYRKLALQWHPDKNPDCIEECTKQFHLIQQAYDVLIDPQERAWYDKHREAILRGGLGHGDEYKDNSIDVYQYFNSSCYSGFGDDERGFYAVYAEVFKTISLEDLEYTNDVNAAPEFGNSQSLYEEIVGPFYAYWESYTTAKSYAWVDKYDTREAPNRQIRRLMEQDNKKLRDKARRERNEEVRALAAYVRKRDHRVQAYKKRLEERAQEISRLAEEKKKRDRQQRLKKLENYKESSWSSMSELERQLKQLEMNVAQQFGDDDTDGYPSEEEVAAGDNAEADDDDETLRDDFIAAYADSLYCVACNKSFKSDKAFDNHSRSKKHLENVCQLQLEMAEDDKLMAAANDETDLPEEYMASDVEENTDVNTSRSKSKKQKKKRKQLLKVQTQNECHDEDDEQNEDASKNRLCMETDGAEERFGSFQSPPSDEQELTNDKNKVLNGDEAKSVEVSQSRSKQKNRKSAKSNAASGQTKSAAPASSQQSTCDDQLSCNKCHEVFESRNKLFDHIKTTGHALHVDSCDVVNDNTKSKSKKGKRK